MGTILWSGHVVLISHRTHTSHFLQSGITMNYYLPGGMTIESNGKAREISLAEITAWNPRRSYCHISAILAGRRLALN